MRATGCVGVHTGGFGGPGRVAGIMPEPEEEETGPHYLLPHSGRLQFTEVLVDTELFFFILGAI